MPRRGVMQGIAKGLNDFTETLVEIEKAKGQIKQQKELFAINKKKAELDLKKAEMQFGVDQQRREELKKRTALLEAVFDNQEFQLNKKSNEIKGQKDQLGTFGQGVDFAGTLYELDLVGYGKGEDFPIRQVSDSERRARLKERRINEINQDYNAGVSKEEMIKKYGVEYVEEINKLYPEKKEESPYKGVAEWEKKNAQKTLFTEWMKSLQGSFEESAIDRYSPAWSKNEILREFFKGNVKYKTSEGKLDAQRMINELGLTTDDFYKWAVENQPNLAKIAFPGKTGLK